MADPEHLAILKKGAEAWNTWRQENERVEPDLSGANLIGVDLTSADLSGVDLTGANLTQANLAQATDQVIEPLVTARDEVRPPAHAGPGRSGVGESIMSHHLRAGDIN